MTEEIGSRVVGADIVSGNDDTEGIEDVEACEEGNEDRVSDARGRDAGTEDET